MELRRSDKKISSLCTTRLSCNIFHVEPKITWSYFPNIYINMTWDLVLATQVHCMRGVTTLTNYIDLIDPRCQNIYLARSNTTLRCIFVTLCETSSFHEWFGCRRNTNIGSNYDETRTHSVPIYSNKIIVNKYYFIVKYIMWNAK